MTRDPALDTYDLAEVATPCERSTWIAIELLDEDGVPVPDEPFELVLPDGEIRQGRLDGSGRALVTGIAPGVATVRFVARDRDDFGPLPHMPIAREARPWLELELLDDAGVGVAGEPFEVVLPDGTVRSGALDEHGRARLEGLAEGECQVRFVARDRDDVTPGEVVGEPAT